jgi:tetratricopeptide (TPR) repeat protein
MNRKILLTFVCLVLWCLGGTVFAQSDSKESTEKAKILYQQGESYFKLKKYDRAVLLYEEAYVLTQRPNFLFNIGLCHKYLGNYEKSQESFQAFLDSNPKKEFVSSTQKRLREVELLKASKEAQLRIEEAKKEEAKPQQLSREAQQRMEVAKKEEIARIAAEANQAEEAAKLATTEAEAEKSPMSIDPFAVYRRPLAPTFLIGVSVLTLGGSGTTAFLALQEATKSKELEKLNFDKVQETFAKAKQLALISDVLTAATVVTGASGIFLALRYRKKVNAFREKNAAVYITPNEVMVSFNY